MHIYIISKINSKCKKKDIIIEKGTHKLINQAK